MVSVKEKRRRLKNRMAVRCIRGSVYGFEKMENGLYHVHIVKYSGDLEESYYKNFKTIKEAVLYINRRLDEEQKAGFDRMIKDIEEDI